MSDIIDVPTYEQIATILSKLATNYSNLASVFYNVFYSDIPADVTFKMYDESGVLQTYTIPNRAKDMQYILNGTGSPEGQVEASAGSLYQDLLDGEVFIKETQEGTEGWDKLVTSNYLSTYIIKGLGNPNGAVVAARGALYIDEPSAALYIKSSSTGNLGWQLISSDVSSLADTDLDNLSETGEQHFANPSLTNLSGAGQALFDSKVDTNDVISILDDSLIDPQKLQVPTADSTYELITSSVEDLANKQLNNLSTAGNLRFIDWSLIGEKSSVLSAPDGEVLKPSTGSSSFYVPADSVLLFANGVASGKYNNIAVTLTENILGSVAGLSGTCLVFAIYNASTAGISLKICSKSDFVEGAEDPTIGTNGAVYFNTDKCQYFINTGSDWEVASATLLGSIDVSSDTISAIHPAKVLKLMTGRTEFGGTEDNWYRLHPDGWLEQGGYITNGGTVSFNKAFKNANYTFIASGASFTKSAGSVSITGSGEINWMAQGWAQ